MDKNSKWPRQLKHISLCTLEGISEIQMAYTFSDGFNFSQPILKKKKKPLWDPWPWTTTGTPGHKNSQCLIIVNSSLSQWWHYSCFTLNTWVPLQIPKTCLKKGVDKIPQLHIKQWTMTTPQWMSRGSSYPLRKFANVTKSTEKQLDLLRNFPTNSLPWPLLCKVWVSSVFSCAYRIKIFLSANADI